MRSWRDRRTSGPAGSGETCRARAGSRDSWSDRIFAPQRAPPPCRGWRGRPRASARRRARWIDRATGTWGFISSECQRRIGLDADACTQSVTLSTRRRPPVVRSPLAASPPGRARRRRASPGSSRPARFRTSRPSRATEGSIAGSAEGRRSASVESTGRSSPRPSCRHIRARREANGRPSRRRS